VSGTIQKKPLNVLIVEDSEFDARIMVNVLRQGGYDPKWRRVETADSMRSALNEGDWEVILSDYNMPAFSAPEALQLLQASARDLPFIIVSGGIGEDTAVAAMKAGAHDYLMKGHLARLVPAVEREIREAVGREARRQAEAGLRESELRYRLLFETATDAVLVMDTQGTIQFANPAIQAVFGYRPDDLMGCSVTQLQPERLRDGSQGFHRYFKDVGERPECRVEEMIGLRQDGTEILIEAAFSDMELHGAQQLVAFLRDITQRRKTEQALHESQEQFRVAREIQQRLFPKAAPHVPGFDIAGMSYPAEATGGDYFDFIPMLGGRIGVVVGDVTGHGIGPAMLMAETRAYLRIVARNREHLSEILPRVNRMLAEDVDFERFVTVLMVSLDPENRTFVYANAGHPAGLVLDAQGAVKSRLKRTAVPLGLKPDTDYRASDEVRLSPGDILVLLTDGVEEALSAAEEFFGTERTIQVVQANRNRSAAEIVSALYNAVCDFAHKAPQLDDVTVVIAKVQPFGGDCSS
jgi:PAS domain S-box-containing protein